MDWIQGNKFQDIAEFSYAPYIRHQDDYYNLVNTFDIEKLRDVNIVFTNPFYAKQLFDVIRPLDSRFIVVSHNGDNRIDSDGVAYLDGSKNMIHKDFFSIPDNVIKWYVPNVNTDNSRIESLPTGLENDFWNHAKGKKEKMLEKLNENRNLRNLLYMDFTIRYNSGERAMLYQSLGDEPWVTAIKDQQLNFERYIDNVYNHKFVLCPEGNGVGTHREWEVLYMGNFPVQKRNLNNRFYTELPICFVNNWSELTEDFLNKEYERITHSVCKLEMLTFDYWKNKIINGD